MSMKTQLTVLTARYHYVYGHMHELYELDYICKKYKDYKINIVIDGNTYTQDWVVEDYSNIIATGSNLRIIKDSLVVDVEFNNKCPASFLADTYYYNARPKFLITAENMLSIVFSIVNF